MFAEGAKARYLRLTVTEVPYGVPPCISGLRAFGKGSGAAPEKPEAEILPLGELDFTVSTAEHAGTLGYSILWGHCPDKLYHSCLVMGAYLDGKKIGARVKGQDTWVRVDAFNENGITHGEVRKL